MKIRTFYTLIKNTYTHTHNEHLPISAQNPTFTYIVFPFLNYLDFN